MIGGMSPRFDPSPVASLPVTWANVLTGVLLASGIQGFIDWSATLLVLAAATLLHLGDVRSPRDGTDDASYVSGRGFLLIGAGAVVAWMIRPECGVVATIFAVIMILDDLRGRRGLTGILAFATRRTTLYVLGYAAAIPQPLDGIRCWRTSRRVPNAVRRAERRSGRNRSGSRKAGIEACRNGSPTCS